MLTAEQLELKTRSIGGSEAHVLALVDGPGKRTPLQLWARKRRGPNLEIAPIVEPELDDDKCAYHGKMHARANPLKVGQHFEQAVVTLYEDMTGLKCDESPTLHMPGAAHFIAHPDRTVDHFAHGLEVKMVGQWASHRWRGECVPGYVVCQAQWYMAVTERERWDVAAWVSGTDVLVQSVVRDDSICEGLVTLATRFWEDHVLADVAPEPTDPDDLREFLSRRFPKDDGKLIDAPDDAAVIALALDKVKRAKKKLEYHEDSLTAKLVQMVEDHKGIVGKWGTFTHAGQAGRVAWRKVAEHLADGAVDNDLVEAHRGAPYRRPGLYLKKGRNR